MWVVCRWGEVDRTADVPMGCICEVHETDLAVDILRMVSRSRSKELRLDPTGWIDMYQSIAIVDTTSFDFWWCRNAGPKRRSPWTCESTRRINLPTTIAICPNLWPFANNKSAQKQSVECVEQWVTENVDFWKRCLLSFCWWRVNRGMEVDGKQWARTRHKQFQKALKLFVVVARKDSMLLQVVGGCKRVGCDLSSEGIVE
jgi:hypothetical protein